MNEDQNENQDSLNSESAAPQAESQTQVTISKSTLKKAGISVAALVVVIVGALIFSSTKSDNRLSDAVSNCDASLSGGVLLAEDHQSLTFDGKGETDLIGGNITDLVCFLDELKAPSTVLSRMESTNSLMGVQNAEWDGITVGWSYHPSNGLDANFEIVK